MRLTTVMEIVGRRWVGGILLALGTGAERFTAIQNRVQGLSARMLTLRLRELEGYGLVERIVEPTVPVSIRYHLTGRGIDLLRALQPIGQYSRRWEEAPGEEAAAS